MAVISERRGPVIGFALLAWLVLLALLSALSRGRLAGPGVQAGRAHRRLPAAGAAARRGARAGPGSRTAAGDLRRAAARGGDAARPRRLPRAGGRRRARRSSPTRSTSIAGSPLTSLSLLGPNPGLGVRFYGIGNELEALLAVLVVAGTGAALTGFAPRASSQGTGGRLPRRRVRSPRSSSPPAASAPTSAPRSSCRSAPRSPPRRSASAARRAVLLAVSAPVAAVALLAAGRPRSPAPTPT